MRGSTQRESLADQRFCCQPNCNLTPGLKLVEDEVHFLCVCNQYKNLRQILYSKIDHPGFSNMTVYNKFNFLLTTAPLARNVGQFIVDAFDHRIK